MERRLWIEAAGPTQAVDDRIAEAALVSAVRTLTERGWHVSRADLITLPGGQGRSVLAAEKSVAEAELEA